MLISLRKFLASHSTAPRNFSTAVNTFNCFDDSLQMVQTRLEDPDLDFISERAYNGIFYGADFVIDLIKDSERICADLFASELVLGDDLSTYQNLINLLDAIVSSDLESVDVCDYDDLYDRLIDKICSRVYEYNSDDSKELEVIANYSAPFRSFTSLSLKELDMLSVILLDLIDCD